MAKTVAAMAAIYVISEGYLTLKDGDGTPIEKGPGGKVTLTADEVKALPDSVKVEPIEDYRKRITASRAKPADLLAALPAGQVQSEISEATAVRLAESNEKLATAISRLAEVPGASPQLAESNEQLAAAISKLAEILGAPQEDEDTPAEDDEKSGDKSKSAKAS